LENENYLEVLEKLRLIDDAFFSACFDDNPEDVYNAPRNLDKKNDENKLG